MATLTVLDTTGKKTDSIDLDAKVFDGVVNTALMHQAVVTYLANQRRGLASTKTKGEVSGGGKKPWKQKGTGRARSGSTRSPLWKGGGKIFGPLPHSYHKDLPKRMKNLALKSALNAKVRDNEMFIINDLTVSSPKTKNFSAIIKNLKLEDKKIRFVVEKIDKNLKLSSRNIGKVFINTISDVNTYDTLNCKTLIFTKNALKNVETRIKKYVPDKNSKS